MVDSETKTSTELQIFKELERLIHTPGYAHVLAALCYKHKLLSTDLKQSRATEAQSEKLIPTEFRILIGLFAKTQRSHHILSPETIEQLMSETELLLTDLHRTFSNNLKDEIKSRISSNEKANEKSRSAFFREAMIYTGESAYTFQYRDLISRKYSNDDHWLIDNKGFSIEDVCAVFDAIQSNQFRILNSIYDKQEPSRIPYDEVLAMYVVSKDAIASSTGLPLSQINAVIDTFSIKDQNQGFRTPSDFNGANAAPMIPCGDSQYFVFEIHILAESIYESPFYWMMADPGYRDVHTDNRGKFTEDFCAERMRHVFGNERVHTNIQIHKSRGKISTEIDVLAHSADRVVLVQCKSKRLTLGARRGDAGAMKEDFRKGVQHACDQGHASAKLLMDPSVRRSVSRAHGISLPQSIREIFILGVLSDHYPALFLQVEHYLVSEDEPRIGAPLVIDVFALDVITEILDSPLYLLSYLKRRSQYKSRVVAAQELTVLGFHLSNNLWVGPDTDMISLDDEFARDLDSAMVDRRCFGRDGSVPEGILTRFEGTGVGAILTAIKSCDDPAFLEIGMRMLEMSEQALREFDNGCELVKELARNDGLGHDFSILMAGGKFGITVHCNASPSGIAKARLLDHCHRRKYDQRSGRWFGLCLSPSNDEPRFGVRVEFPWEQSDEMQERIKVLGKPSKSISSIIDLARRKR